MKKNYSKLNNKNTSKKGKNISPKPFRENKISNSKKVSDNKINYKQNPPIILGDIRLNKFISDSGYCSRREADNFISMGKVKVNGVVAGIGSRINSKSQVVVNGKTLENFDDTVYIALNKPVGITTTTEKSVKDNVIDFVNYPSRIFPVGRLDKDSEGLLILTNDGDVVNKILRAGNSHEKEYNVRVNKKITDEFILKMSNGVPILDVVTKKCKVKKIDDYTFNIILIQGLNRQIRRMCEYFGYEVTALKRERIMNIKLGNLSIGKWRYLTDKEIDELNVSLLSSENLDKKKINNKNK